MLKPKRLEEGREGLNGNKDQVRPNNRDKDQRIENRLFPCFGVAEKNSRFGC